MRSRRAPLAARLLGERVGPRRWAAIGVGFIGVLIVVRPGFGGFQWSFLIPIVMAALYAVYQILTRMIGGVDRPITSLLYPTVIGTTLGALPMPFVWVTPTWQDIGIGLLVGLASTMGQWVVVLAYRYADASVLAPFTYSQLIWATAGGRAVFGALPDRWTLAGAGLIIASGLYTAHRERVRSAERRGIQ